MILRRRWPTFDQDPRLDPYRDRVFEALLDGRPAGHLHVQVEAVASGARPFRRIRRDQVSEGLTWMYVPEEGHFDEGWITDDDGREQLLADLVAGEFLLRGGRYRLRALDGDEELRIRLEQFWPVGRVR